MNHLTHENFSSDHAPTSGSSDRMFGFVIAGASALFGVLNWWHHGRAWPWELGTAILFLAAACIKPETLRLLNRLWMKFGLVLHAIVSPIVMGLLFYGTIWPTGIVMRLRGQDLLRLKQEPNSDTYWIQRTPGPSPETMKDQF